MERRVRGGRCENQSRAARMRPARLSLRSGRSGLVSGGSAERPACHRFLRSRSLRGTLRTLPVTVSRYALRIADPPVMIMAVSAAPRRVPATPNREVTNAATAAANPAAITWVPLTTGALLAASLTVPTLPTDVPSFKEGSGPLDGPL